MALPTRENHDHSILGNVLQPIRQAGHRLASLFAPASQAGTSQDAYTIDIELPGVKRDHVDVEVVGGDTLVVRGEKRDKRESRKEGHVFSEFTFGQFERAFALPADANIDGIDATFEDGVLTLRIPRREDQQRRITVRRG
jgi:HSP20 family protein